MLSKGADGWVKIALLPKDKFYATLTKLKIKTGTKDNANLTKFLKQGDAASDHIVVKKLIVIIEEFLRNHYLKSFGYKKRRMEDFIKADESKE